MLFLCLAQLPLWAQSSDYNPANPGDPQVPIRKYSLKLKASPSNGCSFNYASEQKWESQQADLRGGISEFRLPDGGMGLRQGHPEQRKRVLLYNA